MFVGRREPESRVREVESKNLVAVGLRRETRFPFLRLFVRFEAVYWGEMEIVDTERGKVNCDNGERCRDAYASAYVCKVVDILLMRCCALVSSFSCR